MRNWNAHLKLEGLLDTKEDLICNGVRAERCQGEKNGEGRVTGEESKTTY